MIRFACPKGRTRETTHAALAAAGLDVAPLRSDGRALTTRLVHSEGDVEVLALKDWDLPLYVERGVADCGVVRSDVLGEVDGDLLVPVRLLGSRCRFSLIGRAERGVEPRPGSQVRLATKYPKTARRLLASRSWSVEILPLSGSVELAPVLDLADFALDIVETGGTIAANGLVEIEVLEAVEPCFVVQRAAYQTHRARLNVWFARMEAAGVCT